MGIARPDRKVLWGASGEYMSLADADEHFMSLLPSGASLWNLSKEASFDELSFTIDKLEYLYPEALIRRHILLKETSFFLTKPS